MSVESWDADQAVLLPLDEDGDDDPASLLTRYGVTGWESSHPEPLTSVLSAEVPDRAAAVVDDDQWVEVDEHECFPGRLLADADEADVDYAVAVDDGDDYTPEERAMHTVEV